MAVTQPAQGFFGIVYIGGARYTVRANPVFRMGRNIATAPIIGTGYPYLYADGVRFPTITLSLIPRNQDATATYGNPLSSAFFTYFLSRSAVPVFDTPVIGGTMPGALALPVLGTDIANPSGAGIAFSDGASITLLYGVKAESLRISCAKGQDLMIEATFVATGVYQYNIDESNLGADSIQSLVQAMLPTTAECAAQVRFPHVTFEEAYLDDKVFGFNISYANNHTPNMGLDGTLFPQAMNGGMPSGSMSLTLQGMDDIPGDLAGSPGDSATLRVESSSGIARLFMPNMVPENPYDRSAPLGRVLRTYNYTLFGDCNTPNTVTAGNLQLLSSTY